MTLLGIESCHQDKEYLQVPHRTLGPKPAMSYAHAGKSELMRALPDILGWSHGRGGKFREAIKPVATDLGTSRCPAPHFSVHIVRGCSKL